MVVVEVDGKGMVVVDVVVDVDVEGAEDQEGPAAQEVLSEYINALVASPLQSFPRY